LHIEVPKFAHVLIVIKFLHHLLRDLENFVARHQQAGKGEPCALGFYLTQQSEWNMILDNVSDGRLVIKQQKILHDLVD
jgi:hypothetical protein